MWARAKKIHIEKKTHKRSPQGQKSYKSLVSQDQPMGYIPHEKYIIF